MYPVTLGIEEAKRRILTLLENGHSAEALVTGTFTIEKTLRRVLRQLIVSAGFTSKSADSYLKKVNGLRALKEEWRFFDPHERSLPTVIGEAIWNQISSDQNGYAAMRNQLVHGIRVYNLKECEDKAKALLDTLDSIIQTLDDVYGYNGWSRPYTRKRSALHCDPRVKT
jgi:hypothetical protein